MKVIANSNSVPIKMWTDHVPVEAGAIAQLSNLATMPFIFKHVAVMPDVHVGIGSTVGSVIPTKGAIIPAAVGVDIGCGMVAVKTGAKASHLPDNLHNVRLAIEAKIPHGRTDNGGPNDRGAWGNTPTAVEDAWSELKEEFKVFQEGFPGAHLNSSRGAHPSRQLGTLGTGNHFIEVCLDEEDSVWVMLHSGSRGVGNKIGTYFINLAKEDMRKWFINLPDANLAYLVEGTDNFKNYVSALSWAQDYAKINRTLMMNMTLSALRNTIHVPELKENLFAVDCHHNYVEKENHFKTNVWVTRKGAVRARKDDYGIIPGSMGTKSYIVRGLGNKDSFDSCSHGAGRRMSRTEASNTFSVEDHKKATEGVECRKDSSVIDETPMAYKDIDSVMESQKENVEIVHTLKQVLCVKG